MKTQPRKKWFVGIKPGGSRVMFADDHTPTPERYPDIVAVIGPHQTKRGAILMRDIGAGNPHLQTAADADHMARYFRRHDRERRPA